MVLSSCFQQPFIVEGQRTLFRNLKRDFILWISYSKYGCGNQNIFAKTEYCTIVQWNRTAESITSNSSCLVTTKGLYWLAKLRKYSSMVFDKYYGHLTVDVWQRIPPCATCGWVPGAHLSWSLNLIHELLKDTPS